MAVGLKNGLRPFWSLAPFLSAAKMQCCGMPESSTNRSDIVVSGNTLDVVMVVKAVRVG